MVSFPIQKKNTAQPRFPFSPCLPSFGGTGVISLGLPECPRAVPQSAGSSSEPSWQSASPSHAQRCGMQWPLRHWKLEASQVWDTAGSRAGSGAEHGALSTTQPCALPSAPAHHIVLDPSTDSHLCSTSSHPKGFRQHIAGNLGLPRPCHVFFSLCCICT